MRRPETDLRAAILISGSGSTMESVLKARRRGDLDGIAPIAVIASSPDALGLVKAEKLRIATYVVNRAKYSDRTAFGKDLLALLADLRIDIVSQNGWMPITPKAVVEAYEGRIINQHPGPLDPGRAIDFGGKGMHGAAVSCARLAYAGISGDGYWTEATVHHVVEGVDEGDIIATRQMSIPDIGYPTSIADLQNDSSVLREMTLQVQSELLPREHELVIQTFRDVGVARSFSVYERSCPLIPAGYEHIAQEAKELAVTLYP